jgi:regulator of sigma E protease
MSAIEGLFGFGGSALGVLLPFLFVLTVVVFFHELGHFSIARLCGVAIETFSIGFGPELYGWNDKHGTRWRIAVIPFGGYVKFAGDQGPASNPDDDFLSRLSPEQRSDNFHFKPVWQRMAVVAAGPLANFVLSIVVFALIFMIIGQQVTVPRVESVQSGSAAEQAGFQPNDLITGIDGHKINSFFEMQRLVMSSPDQRLVFQIQRGDQTIDLTAVPARRDVTDRFGNVHHIGLLGISRQQTPDDLKVVRLDPASALMAGTYEVYFVVERTLTYLGRVAGGIESGDQLSGPLRIAQVSGQAAELGFMTLVNLVAVLSVSVGLVNLFPVPLLDGGHLLFYGVEAVRGRPLSARTQEFGFRIGLAAVISLMLFSTWNDLVQLRVVHFLTGLFS